MYELKELERYLRVNLLGPGPRLIKKNLPGRGLTKVEKHCSKRLEERSINVHERCTTRDVSATLARSWDKIAYPRLYLKYQQKYFKIIFERL